MAEYPPGEKSSAKPPDAWPARRKKEDESAAFSRFEQGSICGPEGGPNRIRAENQTHLLQ
jgi:hypothetical protein